MKRRRRWVFNILTVLSLFVCLLLVFLFFRSRRTGDLVVWYSKSESGTHRQLDARSVCGRISFVQVVVKRAEPTVRIMRIRHHSWSLDGFDYDGYIKTISTRDPFHQYPLGIWSHRQRLSDKLNTFDQTTSTLSIPSGVLIVITMILPLCFVIGVIRRRRQRRLGRCQSCGYDLRASPGRCPECGHEAAAA